MEGLSMESLKSMLWPLLVITIFAAVWLSYSALSERVFFRMGVRNLFRRRTQTFLTFVGLMFAAMIFSASFATGDTLTHSIRSLGVNIFEKSIFELKANRLKHWEHWVISTSPS